MFESGGMHTQAGYVLYWRCNLDEIRDRIKKFYDESVRWS